MNIIQVDNTVVVVVVVVVVVSYPIKVVDRP